MRRCPTSIGGYAASSEGTIAITVCRATGMRWTASTMKSAAAGFVRFDAEANAGSRGTGSISGSLAFLFLVRAFPTRGRLSLDDSDAPREEPSAGKPHARICGGEAEWPSYPTIPPRRAAHPQTPSEQPSQRRDECSTADEAKRQGDDSTETLRPQPKPHDVAAEDHHDRSCRDGIHRQRPKGRQRPVSPVPRVCSGSTRTRVKDVHHPPRVQLRSLHGRASPLQVGLHVDVEPCRLT